MKSFIVLALFVAAAVAAPPSSNDRDAVVLRFVNDNVGFEGYNTAVETSNGITQEEQGILKNSNTNEAYLVKQGQYSYTGPDGIVYTVKYIADENGYSAQGAHLPKA